MAQSHHEAKRHYRRHTPLHGASKKFKQDLEDISASNTAPSAKAETLIAQRRNEVIDEKILKMLSEQQGPRRKRYTYNQEAVIGLEHVIDGPLDPQTQIPIWLEMLRKTQGCATLSKPEFYHGARSMLIQHSLYSPETMGG